MPLSEADFRRPKNAAALVDAVRGCKGVESVNLVSYSGESIG